MELFILGINALLFAFFWNFIWSKTALDSTRDQIFDLRDNAREWFLAHTSRLDGEQYLALRELLNLHLRHTESITFIRYFATMFALDRNPQLSNEVNTKLRKKFRSDNPDINTYISETRKKAAVILFLHMVKRSMFLSLVFSVTFFSYTIYSYVRNLLHSLTNRPKLSYNFHCTALAATLLMTFIPQIPYGKYFSQNRLERYSMQSTSNNSCRQTSFC